MYGYVATRFFKESSEEERGHAEKLIKFQVFPKCLLVLYVILYLVEMFLIVLQL